eukprot:m.243407 g.243407  ORF g.243407 m.243407 type:complete len:398 (+) comp10949_c2_seq3:667-1860(+)
MAICRGCGRPALPRNGLQRLGAPLPVLFLAASVDAQTDANKHTAPAMASCARPSDDTDGLLNALHLWEAGQLEQSRDVLLGLMGEEPVSAAVFALLDCVLNEQPSLTPVPSVEHGSFVSDALHKRIKAAPEAATRSSLGTLEAASATPHNLVLQGFIRDLRFDEKEEAVRLYKLAADQGLVAAQHNLAVCYEYGKGVEQDQEEAVRLYRLAADQGFAPAQKILGFLFRKGTGVDQNLQEAVRMYRLAAIQGYAGAQKNLAFCYQYGEGVEQDLNEALRLYRLAADRGHAAAQQGLGFCYHQGMGVKKDLTQAARLYKLAADQGDAGAQAMMSDPEIARAFAETPWSRREPLEFGARAEETMIATLCSAKRRGLRLPVEMWELVFSFMNREDFGVKAQ